MIQYYSESFVTGCKNLAESAHVQFTNKRDIRYNTMFSRGKGGSTDSSVPRGVVDLVSLSNFSGEVNPWLAA